MTSEVKEEFHPVVHYKLEREMFPVYHAVHTGTRRIEVREPKFSAEGEQIEHGTMLEVTLHQHAPKGGRFYRNRGFRLNPVGRVLPGFLAKYFEVKIYDLPGEVLPDPVATSEAKTQNWEVGYFPLYQLWPSILSDRLIWQNMGVKEPEDLKVDRVRFDMIVKKLPTPQPDVYAAMIWDPLEDVNVSKIQAKLNRYTRKRIRYLPLFIIWESTHETIANLGQIDSKQKYEQVLTLEESFTEKDLPRHENVLLFDTFMQTVEWFEPHGPVYFQYLPEGFTFMKPDGSVVTIATSSTILETMKQLQGYLELPDAPEKAKKAYNTLVEQRNQPIHQWCRETIEEFLKRLTPAYTLISAEVVCPFLGPQHKDIPPVIQQSLKNFVGFCSAYSAMYAHLRMLNPNLHPTVCSDWLARAGRLGRADWDDFTDEEKTIKKWKYVESYMAWAQRQAKHEWQVEDIVGVRLFSYTGITEKPKAAVKKGKWTRGSR